MRKNLGFTLLEMLVVIGLIGVLVGLGSVSYSTAQKKARDAKRKSDLKSIQNAFEQYYSICGYKYPGSIPAGGSKLTATTAVCTSLTANVDIITMPADPLGGDYTCAGGSTCDSAGYKICPPASVNGGKLLETQDCLDTSCCVGSQQ